MKYPDKCNYCTKIQINEDNPAHTPIPSCTHSCPNPKYKKPTPPTDPATMQGDENQLQIIGGNHHPLGEHGKLACQPTIPKEYVCYQTIKRFQSSPMEGGGQIARVGILKPLFAFLYMDNHTIL